MVWTEAANLDANQERVLHQENPLERMVDSSPRPPNGNRKDAWKLPASRPSPQPFATGHGGVNSGTLRSYTPRNAFQRMWAISSSILRPSLR